MMNPMSRSSEACRALCLYRVLLWHQQRCEERMWERSRRDRVVVVIQGGHRRPNDCAPVMPTPSAEEESRRSKVKKSRWGTRFFEDLCDRENVLPASPSRGGGCRHAGEGGWSELRGEEGAKVRSGSVGHRSCARHPRGEWGETEDGLNNSSMEALADLTCSYME